MFQHEAAVGTGWCWESAWQAGWRPAEKCTGLTGAVAPWLRPPKDFEGVVKRKGELQQCAAWWMGFRRESRVARTPVSVGRPSAQAPALRCTPQKCKGGVNQGVSFHGVFDVHRFYSSRVKFYLVG